MIAGRVDPVVILRLFALEFQIDPEGFVKLPDYRLFSAFLHEAKPLKLHMAAISDLPRFRSESS